MLANAITTLCVSAVVFLQLHSASSLVSPKCAASTAKFEPPRSIRVALSAYHFGVSSDTNKKREDNFPYANLSSKSYVPDGLTEEQYQKIRQEDLAKLQGKNFGAWGPRFKLVDGDPQGNWFSISSLWTVGFRADQNGAKNVSNPQPMRKNSKNVDRAETHANKVIVAVFAVMRHYAMAYLALMLSTNVLANTLSSRARNLVSSKWIAARLLLPLLVVKPVDSLARFASRVDNSGWFSKNGTSKLAAVFGGILTVVAMALR